MPARPASTRAPRTAPGTGQVRVLARGLSVLRAFTPRNEWLSNQEIAARTSLPRPTVSRIASNLTGLGYLAYSPGLGKYRLGTSVLALGFCALANLDIRGAARPLLQQLADSEDALAVLASRDGLAMVCNEVCHSSKSLFTLRVNAGSRLVLPYSAMGLALLGAMPDAERERESQQIKRSFRKDWPGLRDLIATAAEQMKRRGFCTTLGTLEHGINGISVVIDAPGAPHSYALGLAGPSFKFPPERLENELGPKLQAMKRSIEARLAAATPRGAEAT
jgi:DNA-binding IclR family transcriptional regulator